MAELSPENQKKEIKQIWDNWKMKEGQEWYIVEYKWYQMWKFYVNYENENQEGGKPESIDNSSLLHPESDKLREGLREEYDYVVVPLEVWNKWQSWYGGGPKIVRKVITTGVGQKLRVDLYPLTIYSNRYTGGQTNKQQATPISVSRNATVRELRRKLAGIGMTAPHKIRLLRVDPESDETEILDSEEQTLEELNVEDGDIILYEPQSHDGSWPRDRPDGGMGPVSRAGVGSDASSTSTTTSATAGAGAGRPLGIGYNPAKPAGAATSSSYTSSYGSSWAKVKNTDGKPELPGLVGLNNLGNTCFMNSALQCLSNTVDLSNFFVSDTYKEDINRDNPLGMKGFLADFYGALMKEIWCGSFSVVAPIKFKNMLGKFAPQFSGYQQHDSQELLAFLLDGLHEDMNRVKKKPYVENVESNGRPDEVVAEESWQGYLLRNRSVIVDLFQGQFKSTVVCPIPECERVSITFDPFMYLSVPLPVSNDKAMFVTMVFCDKPALKYALKLSKNGTIFDIKRALAEQTDLTVDQFGVCDVYGHKIFQILSDTKQLQYVRETDDIYCFEIVAPPETEVEKPKKKDSMDTKDDASKPAKMESEPTAAPPANVVVEHGPGLVTVTATAQPRSIPMEPRPIPKDNPIKYVPVIHRERKLSQYTRKYKYELFGFPFVLSVDPTKTTNRQLYEMIWGQSKLIYAKDEAVPEKREKPAVTPKEGDEGDPSEPMGDFPFKIYLATGYNLVPMTLIPLNDEAHGPFPSAYKLQFVVDWTDEGRDLYYDPRVRYHSSMSEFKAEQEKALNLPECISLFTRQEQLGVENTWYCSKCQEHRQAFKKFDLWKVPTVLVIHLKRFQYSRLWRDKIEQKVDFPLEGLDLSPFIVGPIDPDNPPVYNLYAVSNHSGGMGFGHYTAYGRNKLTQKWYKYNDSSVSEVRDPSEIVSSQAYLLFYERATARDVQPVTFEYKQSEIDAIYRSGIASSGGGDNPKGGYAGAGSARAGAGPLTSAGTYSSKSALDDIDGVEDDRDYSAAGLAVNANANAGNVGKGKAVAGAGEDIEMDDVAGGSTMDESDDEDSEGGLGRRPMGAAAAAAAAAVAGTAGVAYGVAGHPPVAALAANPPSPNSHAGQD